MEPENQLTSTLHSNIAQPAIGVVQTFEEKLLRKNLKYNICLPLIFHPTSPCLRARVHVYLVQSCRAIIFRPHHFLLNCRKSDYFFKIIQLLASSLISFWFLGLIKDFQQKGVGFQVFLQSCISSLSSGGWLEVDEGWQRQGTQITIILYCFCATIILYC